MSNPLAYLFQHRRRRKGETARLAAQLAPLEEQAKPADPSGPMEGAVHEAGAIVVENEGLRLSKDILEDQYGKGFLGMEPVVLVILGLMLAFIGLIAWQISLMPVE